jgi:DNA-binding response OmpR family regulator
VRPRILTVEDDEEVRVLVANLLSEAGYAVDQAEDALTAMERLGATDPDLVILDVMMPRVDGFEFLEKIRQTRDVPVILLTGRGAENEKIRGFRLGADDYVVKPFSPAELVARVETVLRRTFGSAAPAAAAPAENALRFEGLEIDRTSREVRVDGRLISLTAKEFDLLAFLAGSPRQVFSRAQLLNQVWSSSADWQDDATVTEHVRRIRRKVEADPDAPRWIVTVRGAGYRFEP